MSFDADCVLGGFHAGGPALSFVARISFAEKTLARLKGSSRFPGLCGDYPVPVFDHLVFCVLCFRSICFQPQTLIFRSGPVHALFHSVVACPVSSCCVTLASFLLDRPADF